jgi:hypothetical protein
MACYCAYRSERGPVVVVHHMKKLLDLHDLIENGPFNSISITPMPPRVGQGVEVRTWVSSRRKNPWGPGQLSVEINTTRLVASAIRKAAVAGIS